MIEIEGMIDERTWRPHLSRPKPMSEEEYEALYARQRKEFGVHAAALALAETTTGRVLMVQPTPGEEIIPYTEYAERLREKNGELPEDAEKALQAIRAHAGETALTEAGD